jgi:hypothetical protein
MKAKAKDLMAAKIPNTSPISVREKNMDTRKGMRRITNNSHINERNTILPIWHECTHNDKKQV